MREKAMYFNELLTSWLEEIRLEHAPSTYVKYKRMSGRYIEPFFEGERVAQIRLPVLIRYRESILDRAAAGELSDGSIRCLLMIVNGVMGRAFERQLLPDLIHVPPRVRRKKHVVQVYSSEEQKKLEAYLQEHMSLSLAAIYLCLYTGLRLGEICALRWENINTKEGYIHVKSTVQRLALLDRRTGEDACAKTRGEAGRKSELLLTAPKSSSSNRLVPVPSFLLPLLEEYRKKAAPESFFLSGQPDLPMEPRTFQYQYKRCLAQAGLRYLNFHSIRHTFATRCITIGMDPKTLSEILGHSDIKITLEYYFHSSFEFKKNQIERLASPLVG